jgi:uncharacterized RDD family membrane protein YckC
MPRFYFEKPDRHLCRAIAVALAVIYVVDATSLVTLKLTLAMFTQVPFAELIYGPAITTVCVFGLFWIGASIRMSRGRA